MLRRAAMLPVVRISLWKAKERVRTSETKQVIGTGNAQPDLMTFSITPRKLRVRKNGLNMSNPSEPLVQFVSLIDCIVSWSELRSSVLHQCHAILPGVDGG